MALEAVPTLSGTPEHELCQLTFTASFLDMRYHSLRFLFIPDALSKLFIHSEGAPYILC
jgi:hypothetical protein